jgi:hypothetical protein
MPIRLNLLAEAQAAEELRRRDPVKRAIWGAAVLVAVMLVWSGSLQFKVMLAKSALSQIEGQMNSHATEYQQVLNNRSKNAALNEKLGKLRLLAADRFLNGSVLNALQHTTVDQVQLLRFRAEQSYQYTEGTKARTNEDRVIAGTPAKSIERILLTLDGSDSSRNQGDQIKSFQETVAANAYLKNVLATTNAITLKYVSPPQVSPASGKACVLFTIECRYPEKTR